MNQTNTSGAPPRKRYCGRCYRELRFVRRVVAEGSTPPVRVTSQIFTCDHCDETRAYVERAAGLPAARRLV
jgi:hypothetical protein